MSGGENVMDVMALDLGIDKIRRDGKINLLPPPSSPGEDDQLSCLAW